MRRLMVVCLSFVFAALISLPRTTAQEILYDNPAWVKGYGAIWRVEHTPDNSRVILDTSTGLYMLNPATPDVTPISLKGHSDSIQSITFSQDGSLMATTSLDGTARLWRLPSGEPVWSAIVGDSCCNGHEPNAASFTADDSLLLVLLGAHTPAGAVAINIRSGKTQVINNNVFPFGARIQGNDLLYLSQDQEGFDVHRLRANGDAIVDDLLKTLSDSLTLADLSHETFAMMNDDYAAVETITGTLIIIHILQDGSTQTVYGTFPIPSGMFGNIVWGRLGDTLSALNLETQARLDIPAQDILSSDNSQWVMYRDTDGNLGTVDLKTLTHMSIGANPTLYRWVQGYLIYVSGTELKVFDPSNGQTVTLAEANVNENNQYLAVQLTGNRIAAVYKGEMTEVGIWDITTGSTIVSPLEVDQYLPPVNLPASNDRLVIPVQQSYDGSRGAEVVDLKAGNLQFWPISTEAHSQIMFGDKLFLSGLNFTLMDLKTGEETRLASDDITVNDLAFSPDGKQLATSNRDNTIRIWDANSGAQVGVIGLQNDAMHLAYGTRGIVTLSADNQVQFLPVPATSKPTAPVSGTDQLYDLAIDRNTIVAGGAGNVQLFALNASGDITAQTTLIPNASLPPLPQYNAVAINARYIAAAGLMFADDGSLDKTVVDLWSATTHKYVRRLDSQTRGDAYDLSFSADDSYLALTSSGTTVVWNLKRSLDEPAYLTSTDFDSGSAFAGNILATLEQSWLTHSINLYTANSGTYVGTLRRKLNSTGGGGGDGYHIPIVGSADGSHIAYVDARGELVMWNVPDQVESVAEGANTRKANVIPYCDSLNGVQVNPTPNQPVNLMWSWFATDISLVYDHMTNAQYEIRLDGTALNHWDFQSSTIHRDKANDNHWTVYYSFDVGMLKPGIHVVNYRLTWKNAISDGITDYGPNTAHPEDIGVCTFTVK